MSTPSPDAPAAAAPGVLDHLFGALADPTRRALFHRLMHDGPQTATVLAADSPLTRQAVVKHLQALGEVGLAVPHREGREVRYAATPEQLAIVLAWLSESSLLWDRRIERLVERSGRPFQRESVGTDSKKSPPSAI